MEQFVWIIVAIIWLIISGINKNKKEQEKQNRKRQTQIPETETQNRQPDTIREILEEMKKQRKADTVQRKPVQQPVKKVKQNQTREITNRQIIIEDREQISENEKQAALEYENFVLKTRNKEHDAEQHHLEQNIMLESESDNYEPLELDLKNIIIADAVMRRPEY